MADPAFKQLVAETGRERWSGALRLLSQHAVRFAATLVQLTAEEHASKPGASVRLRAAMAGLSLRHGIAETESLAERLEELERRAGIDPATGWRTAA
jgi:hypothetical protein